MSIERTLSIIKPDAVGKDIIGQIYSKFETAGLQIIAAKMVRLSKKQVGKFYAVHEDKPFYQQLVEFMSSGPVMIQILEGEDAIQENRKLMGATNPRNAEAGTIRHEFARDNNAEEMHKNIVHGSDSAETAKAEIKFFFSDEDIYSRKE